jgi:hypothetical protein
MKNARVLIGVLSFDGHAYCRQRFVEQLGRIAEAGAADVVVMWNGRDPWGFDSFPVVSYEPAAAETGADILKNKQNLLRERFLQGGYTHLLMLESDNIPPQDVAPTLLSHARHVVSGLYFIPFSEEKIVELSPARRQRIRAKGLGDIHHALVSRSRPVPCAYGMFHSTVFAQRAARMWTVEDWIDFRLAGRRLAPILAGGLGCALIDRAALEAVPFRLSGEAPTRFSDYFFYRDVHGLGLSAFVDTDCVVQHLHVDSDEISEARHWFEPDRR